jgi:hypothetical protein
MLKKIVKTQSILEYLIMLMFLCGFITAGILGFSRGVQKGLDKAQPEIKEKLYAPYEGEVVDFSQEQQE